jgi:hypothetical protein
LDIFALPPTQVALEGAETIVYKPTTSIESDSALEFAIPATSEDYTDLQKTLLYVKASILREDGTRALEADNVGPVNNWIHSLFSEVSISLNGTLLTPPSHLYPYKMYYENLFNYGAGAKESHLGLSLWSKDTSTDMDTCGDDNKGYKQRKEWSQNGAPVAMLGRMSSNIFGQNKYLLNGVGMHITLSHSNNAFRLMTDDTHRFSVKIHDAALYVRRVKISPSILIAHSKVLASTPARYAVGRVEMKQFTIPSTLMSFNIENMFVGQMPVRIIVGLTLNSAVMGNYAQNPYNFKHFNLNYISLTRDGVPVTTKALQPNFNAGQTDYVTSYYSTFSGTNIHFSDDNYAVNRTEFQSGYVLHAFDTSASQESSLNVWQLRKQGVLALELKFSASLTAAVTCVVYAEYQNLVEIDKDRRVTLDY